MLFYFLQQALVNTNTHTRKIRKGKCQTNPLNNTSKPAQPYFQVTAMGLLTLYFPDTHTKDPKDAPPAFFVVSPIKLTL